MVIPASAVEVGDRLLLPRGSMLTVDRVDEYIEPTPSTEDPSRLIVICGRAGDDTRCLPPRREDDTVVLAARNRTPVPRW